MKKSWLLILLSCLFVPSVFFANPELSAQTNAFPLTQALDLDLDLGVSLKKDNSLLSSRVRIGKLWMQGSDVFTAGVDLGKFSVFGLGGGIEGEWIHLPSGLWAQGKALTTQNEILAMGIALGWSLVGIEGLVSPFNANTAAIVAKVRLPIGLLIQ